jgi:hypothetical protein
MRQQLFFTAPFSPPAPFPSPGDADQLRAKLLEMIERDGRATFAGFAAHARDLGFEVDGDGGITHGSPSRNAILYRGVDRLFFTAVNMLVMQGDVYFQPCYRADAIDDRVAGLLIAKRLPANGFCRPTWLPACFLPTPF